MIEGSKRFDQRGSSSGRSSRAGNSMTSQQDMGKRGAVGFNSGEPVDDSGPVLRRPTTPVTAGRKPAACPPDFVPSQSKSRQESENGVLSGASGASGELRSEATQQVSSLDPLQNNRYITSKELERRGRKRNCGCRSLRGSSDDNTERVIRLDCKTWGCGYCGPRKAWRYKQAIRANAEKESLSRFLTLTLDPAHIEGNPVRYLRKTFSKFRVYLLRKYSHSPKYIAVLEFHKSGVPHLHVLIDRYIPQPWIQRAWNALGGGRIVHIEQVDVHRIGHYLAKYLTKELLLSAPEGTRRVTTSRSIHLNEPKKKSDLIWVLDKRSIFCLFNLLCAIAQDVHLDHDGLLVSFVSPIEIDPPSLSHTSNNNVTLGRIQNVRIAMPLVW